MLTTGPLCHPVCEFMVLRVYCTPSLWYSEYTFILCIYGLYFQRYQDIILSNVAHWVFKHCVCCIYASLNGFCTCSRQVGCGGGCVCDERTACSSVVRAQSGHRRGRRGQVSISRTSWEKEALVPLSIHHVVCKRPQQVQRQSQCENSCDAIYT